MFNSIFRITIYSHIFPQYKSSALQVYNDILLSNSLSELLLFVSISGKNIGIAKPFLSLVQDPLICSIMI